MGIGLFLQYTARALPPSCMTTIRSNHKIKSLILLQEFDKTKQSIKGKNVLSYRHADNTDSRRNGYKGVCKMLLSKQESKCRALQIERKPVCILHHQIFVNAIFHVMYITRMFGSVVGKIDFELK
jgi:hypothetical protein